MSRTTVILAIVALSLYTVASLVIGTIIGFIATVYLHNEMDNISVVVIVSVAVVVWTALAILAVRTNFFGMF